MRNRRIGNDGLNWNNNNVACMSINEISDVCDRSQRTEHKLSPTQPYQMVGMDYQNTSILLSLQHSWLLVQCSLHLWLGNLELEIMGWDLHHYQWRGPYTLLNDEQNFPKPLLHYIVHIHWPQQDYQLQVSGDAKLGCQEEPRTHSTLIIRGTLSITINDDENTTNALTWMRDR